MYANVCLFLVKSSLAVLALLFIIYCFKKELSNYYVVPNSRACTAIYLGGNVAIHGLIMHCTLINFRKCGLHVFYLDHFLKYYVRLYASLPVFSVMIHNFLSFEYCDALKDGLARTVKVFRNGARTSLLLSTGVP